MRVRSRSHHIVGVGVERRRRRRRRRRSVRFSSLFSLHIFFSFSFVFGEGWGRGFVFFFFFFLFCIKQLSQKKVLKFLITSDANIFLGGLHTNNFFQIKCVCSSFCGGFKKTNKRMPSSPPKVEEEDNDDYEKRVNSVFFLGQSYARLRVDGKGCDDDDDDFWGKILKEEGRLLAVSVECTTYTAPPPHREGSCLYYVRIESSYGLSLIHI